MDIPAPSKLAPSGKAFYDLVAGMPWPQRDSVALQWLHAGFVPAFFKKWKSVKLQGVDSSSGKPVSLVFFVSPDYLVLGNDADWVRVPLSAMAAQAAAQSLQSVLPTAAMVDAIYHAAIVKLEPVPMLALRDSSVTFYHHHLIIEGQRQGRKGLIAGIKKDIVVTDRLRTSARPNRLAIYGWHKPNGKPIQPLYIGHVDWYTDYSHGVRLVSKRMRISGKWVDADDVLQMPAYKALLTSDSAMHWYPYRALRPG